MKLLTGNKQSLMTTQGQSGKVVALSVSKEKGTKKNNVKSARLKKNWGIIGDVHAGNWPRQVSLLAEESIDKMRLKGLSLRYGDFAENITTRGIDLPRLKLGAKIKVGRNSLLEVSQIGKVCHARCNIYYQAGDCIMPKEGVFARVLKGGLIRPQDILEVVEDEKPNG